MMGNIPHERTASLLLSGFRYIVRGPSYNRSRHTFTQYGSLIKMVSKIGTEIGTSPSAVAYLIRKMLDAPEGVELVQSLIVGARMEGQSETLEIINSVHQTTIELTEAETKRWAESSANPENYRERSMDIVSDFYEFIDTLKITNTAMLFTAYELLRVHGTDYGNVIVISEHMMTDVLRKLEIESFNATMHTPFFRYAMYRIFGKNPSIVITPYHRIN